MGSLAKPRVANHMTLMKLSSRWRRYERNPVVRWIVLSIGVLLLPVAAIVAPIPGPGGIPVALAGITLILRYSRWARRFYVGLKRRWPKHGAWVDWGLRRQSAKRRAEIAKQQEN